MICCKVVLIRHNTGSKLIVLDDFPDNAFNDINIMLNCVFSLENEVYIGWKVIEIKASLQDIKKLLEK